MGSLCCVAARPHGSSVASREWSVGRNEPFWRTNSSFSPPLSARWDYWFHSEGLSYESQGDNGAALFRSSLSSNSKGSRSWGRGESVADQHFSSSDGSISYVSSPSGSFQNNQMMPLHMQGVNVEDHIKEPASETLTFSHIMEGALGVSSCTGSTSSRSDCSEYESILKSHGSAYRGFSTHRSFMSKPIHPLSFPDQSVGCEETRGCLGTTNFDRTNRAFPEIQSFGFSETSANRHMESVQWSSPSSINFTDISEPLEPETVVSSYNSLHEGSKCGLCERLLSQKSPWGSRRLVRSGDLPIISVLSCWHFYHAECLERTTPNMRKHDPPCPLCEKSDANVSEQWAVCKLKHRLPRIRSPGGEGPSRVWSCAQVGDCVEGAMHVPKPSKMMSSSRSRLKRQLSIKGNLVKEHAENSNKSGLCISEVLHGRILAG